MNTARLLAALFLAASIHSLHADTDGALGLHSEGGAWKFYRAKDTDKSLPRVLLVGDSIMNGYRGSVSKALEGKARVDCWLTPLHLASGGLHHDLRKVLAQGPYDVIQFNIGLHGWTPGRIPEGQYEPLLRTYVDILLKEGKPAKLIWASTTPMTTKGKPAELEPEHNPTITKRNAIANKVMAEKGITINDLYSLVVEQRAELARGDRFHWKGDAYQQMGKATADAVKLELKKAETDRDRSESEKSGS